MKIDVRRDSEGNPEINAETQDVDVFVSFTENEEAQLAHAVLALLSERSFQGEDREYLEHVYWNKRCRTAVRLWVDEFTKTLDIIDRWDSYKYFEVYVPKFTDADGEINHSAMYMDGGASQAITSIILIWMNEWEKARDALIKIDDMYKDFPGETLRKNKHALIRPKSHLDKAAEVEERFWAEVDRVEADTKMSRLDCYDYVRDYQKRGRDVIPRVLMRVWYDLEQGLPELIPGAVHPPEEWVQESIAYARDQERFLSIKPEYNL